MQNILGLAYKTHTLKKVEKVLARTRRYVKVSLNERSIEDIVVNPRKRTIDITSYYRNTQKEIYSIFIFLKIQGYGIKQDTLRRNY